MKLSLEEATRLARDALERRNVSPANALCVAQALAAAERDGIPSHGMSRLKAYGEQALAGKVNGHAAPALSRPAKAVVRVDALDGFAFPALRAGLGVLAEIAPEMGVAALAIANSHHCGVAGHHVEWLAERGFIGLMFANAPAAMAPWGGATPTFGTNPIAFAAPRQAAAPLVIDLSLSHVARGKVMLAQQKGEKIPEGWALDSAGQPTTSAEAAMAGTMLPLGGAKGAALALMVEILAATLTGSNHAYAASSFFDAKGGPPRVGQFIVALDPAAFGAGFSARIEALLGMMLAQPGVRLPGAKRLAARAKSLAEGIEVSEGVLALR